MILVSHAQGNAFVRGLLAGLQRREIPLEFHTTVGVASDESWWKKLPESINRKLTRRHFDLPKQSLHRRPFREIMRLGPALPGLNQIRQHESGWASVDGVWRDLDSHVARRIERSSELTAVYTYEDGALTCLLYTSPSPRDRG